MALAAAVSPGRPPPLPRALRLAPRTVVRRLSAQAVRGVTTRGAALCHRSHWVPKSSRASCSNCRRSFRLWATKRHCRLCGEVVCGPCSTKRVLFARKSVRACDDCVAAHERPPTSAAPSTTWLGPRRRTTAVASSTSYSTTGVEFFLSSSSSSPSSSSRCCCSSSSSSTGTPIAVVDYRLTLSRPVQLLLVAVAALAVITGCALERVTQIWM
ncbi:unnamed protein product [Hyaloperonospora brassicae]|uniref:FYVE-type domain-containing protein n=1 Tax=Hyaloperonospora brassicae TaxID=162125 RepID=A0AAV0TBS7_HYABA|nr:unnamed protein product [Hyaloperonospora brassicae]